MSDPLQQAIEAAASDQGFDDSEDMLEFLRMQGLEVVLKEEQAKRLAALETQAQRDHELAAEWQQRANELGAEVEVLRDKTAVDALRIRELEATLRALDVRVLTATQAVTQITNSTQELADDWYAAELDRLGTPTA